MATGEIVSQFSDTEQSKGQNLGRQPFTKSIDSCIINSMDKHNWKYTAVCKFDFAGNEKTLTVTASNYEQLRHMMSSASSDWSFIPRGGKQHNSSQLTGEAFFESYVEDLMFPEIRWKVTRELINK